MSTIVTVKSSKPVLVTSQKIVDGGRELIRNGVDEVAAGTERDFIVDDGQLIQIGEMPVAAEASPAEETAEVTA